MSNKTWETHAGRSWRFCLDGKRRKVTQRESGTRQRLGARGDNQGLLQCSGAFPDPFEGPQSQGLHPLINGNLGNFHGAATSNDYFPDFIGHRHRFQNGGTSGITAAIATVTTPALVKRNTIKIAWGDIQIAVHGRWIRDHVLAMRADLA